MAPKKQGTLFSFFAKKAESKPPSTASAPATAKDQPKPLTSVGESIQVYWPDDDAYYDAKVLKQRGSTTTFQLKYEVDGTVEWIDLNQHKFRSSEEASSDEENEMDDGDESVYEQQSDNDDEEEADQWMVSDEDEKEEEPKPKKKKRKQFQVTELQTPAKRAALPNQITPSMSQFSFTPSQNSKSSQSVPTPSTQASFSPPPLAPPKSVTKKNNKPPMFEKGVVNPPGSHVHNHLPFLQNPRDKQGRTPSQPGYDCRTLKVVESDWTRVNGSKMTDAVKQWWHLKSHYFDCVLLFKTGKFYELYHMDADIGVKVCDLIYMKGAVAHCGFPEIAYASNAHALCQAGYKVARVEQTETPQMLQERKKKRAKGTPAPKVVNREVCSVMTMGTRTFCFLDVSEQLSAPTSSGPLLAIHEAVDPSASRASDSVPVVEYGVTLVDAVHGVVTLGQFADDILRTRLDTLLAHFAPSEILVGPEISKELQSLLESLRKTTLPNCRLETIQYTEQSPPSTALEASVRMSMQRESTTCQPWNIQETLRELHRRGYYPSASKQKTNDESISRWPGVLKAAVEGKAEGVLQSLGAALYYLQRHLVDYELLSMGIVKAYVPPSTTVVAKDGISQCDDVNIDAAPVPANTAAPTTPQPIINTSPLQGVERDPALDTDHLALDGTTLHNLEILYNSINHKVQGSLWHKINQTQTPHGARLLRAWLLRPLYRVDDIARRADAVEELTGMPLIDAQKVLKKCGDLERLLSRVHSMSGGTDDHPNERAVLYETATYTKRKVGDFCKILKGLKAASQIPNIFANSNIESGLLAKIVRIEGGCFPDLSQVDWFFENLDLDQAAKGLFEPATGVDAEYDQAEATLTQIRDDLEAYRKEASRMLRTDIKFINIKNDSKDKFTMELSASVRVPDDFILKSKRGSGTKQMNRYQTVQVNEMVQAYEDALEILKARKARGLQLIFAKFDQGRNVWAAVAQATALLDALVSMALCAQRPNWSRPQLVESSEPILEVKGGRHACMDDDYVPNDLELQNPPILLLSGPNMGGKSTLLRQTCLLVILAQMGCYVPADSFRFTPVDKIYTRLGASDKILLGQSTFFVELAETAAALRGSTSRSLVIMDELGRGTSTFDGTAIAAAVVDYFVQQNPCRLLFATHYHSLLREFQGRGVQLGHLECMVGENEKEVTFLYTLGAGVCPQSFGLNVARMAGLPASIIDRAQEISHDFQANSMEGALERGDWDRVLELWRDLRVNE